MKKYKVIFEQTEHFRVIVEAKDKDDADDKASQMFSNGEYDELGDCDVKTESIEEIKEENLIDKINKVTSKYDVKCLSAIRNIQGSVDIKLDKNIFFKVQKKMIQEIKDIIELNDVEYQDIA